MKTKDKVAYVFAIAWGEAVWWALVKGMERSCSSRGWWEAVTIPSWATGAIWLLAGGILILNGCLLILEGGGAGIRRAIGWSSSAFGAFGLVYFAVEAETLIDHVGPFFLMPFLGCALLVVVAWRLSHPLTVEGTGHPTGTVVAAWWIATVGALGLAGWMINDGHRFPTGSDYLGVGLMVGVSWLADVLLTVVAICLAVKGNRLLWTASALFVFIALVAKLGAVDACIDWGFFLRGCGWEPFVRYFPLLSYLPPVSLLMLDAGRFWRGVHSRR